MGYNYVFMMYTGPYSKTTQCINVMICAIIYSKTLRGKPLHTTKQPRLGNELKNLGCCISRCHLCLLSSIHLSSLTPISSLVLQETKRFSSFGEPLAEFPSNRFNKSLTAVKHNYSDENIFSSKRKYDENRTIFVGGLSKFTTEQLLYKYFLQFGIITGCRLALRKLNGVSKGYRFVEFESVEQAKTSECTYELGLHIIDGQQISQVLSDRPHIIFGKIVNTQQKYEEFAVFVGNLPFDATDDSLFETFSKYGKLVHWEVKRDRNTNRSRGFGYVSFSTTEQTVRAINSGQYILNGKVLRVEPCKTRSWVINTVGYRRVKSSSKFGVQPIWHPNPPRGFGYVTFSSQKELDSLKWNLII
ncbi:RNA recognition motif domain-containing protein [Ditylenchus destructor]|nr:RNA recognition motif domain-containing protein [Ditylenchus destructor]